MDESDLGTDLKEVLITESYSKIFRDSKVQIEDDLDEARDVITNKDVVAYLKDVDFFFQDVRFEFVIEHIEQGTNGKGETFYKVSTTRNLNHVKRLETSGVESRSQIMCAPFDSGEMVPDRAASPIAGPLSAESSPASGFPGIFGKSITATSVSGNPEARTISAKIL